MCCCVGFWWPTSPSSMLSAWIFDYPQYFQNIELVTFRSSVCLPAADSVSYNSSTDTTSTACNSDWNERDAKLNTNCCPLSIGCAWWVSGFFLRSLVFSCDSVTVSLVRQLVPALCAFLFFGARWIVKVSIVCAVCSRSSTTTAVTNGHLCWVQRVFRLGYFINWNSNRTLTLDETTIAYGTEGTNTRTKFSFYSRADWIRRKYYCFCCFFLFVCFLCVRLK